MKKSGTTDRIDTKNNRMHKIQNNNIEILCIIYIYLIEFIICLIFWEICCTKAYSLSFVGAAKQDAEVVAAFIKEAGAGHARRHSAVAVYHVHT